MKKQWKLDNKGMTLLEVIVAFAIFAIAATILITGFNGALKVMGNSEKIKNASQENTGKLNAVGASALEEFEGLKDSEITNESVNLNFTSKYMMPGKIYTATSKEKPDMDMRMFYPDGSKLEPEKLVALPKKAEDKKEEEIEEWNSNIYKVYQKGDSVWYGNPKEYYICIQTVTSGTNLQPPNALPALWNRKNPPDGSPIDWNVSHYYAKDTVVVYNGKKYVSLDDTNHGQQPDFYTQAWQVKNS